MFEGSGRNAIWFMGQQARQGIQTVLDSRTCITGLHFPCRPNSQMRRLVSLGNEARACRSVLLLLPVCARRIFCPLRICFECVTCKADCGLLRLLIELYEVASRLCHLAQFRNAVRDLSFIGPAPADLGSHVSQMRVSGAIDPVRSCLECCRLDRQDVRCPKSAPCIHDLWLPPFRAPLYFRDSWGSLPTSRHGQS